jgi:hypothetical protein
MNADALDMLIEKLEAIMPAAPDPLGLSVVLHDWRPVWNLAKEIQEALIQGFDIQRRNFVSGHGYALTLCATRRLEEP